MWMLLQCSWLLVGKAETIGRSQKCGHLFWPVKSEKVQKNIKFKHWNEKIDVRYMDRSAVDVKMNGQSASQTMLVK